MKTAFWFPVICALCAHSFPSWADAEVALTYHELVLHGGPSLYVKVGKSDPATGEAIVTGSDSACPTIPFTIAWGDGKVSKGFFPLSHTYRDHRKNYSVSLVSHYADGTAGAAAGIVRFVPLVILDSTAVVQSTVSIPRVLPEIVSSDHRRVIPALTAFPDSAFKVYSREFIAHILNEIAAIQLDLVNHNAASGEGAIDQVILSEPESAPHYAHALWYTKPAVVVTKPSFFGGTPDWSAIAHEMGHNITLNSPGYYRLGEAVEGPANAIVIETLAQIFQHVTCYELVNHAAEHGIPEEIAVEIAQSALDSFASLRSRSRWARFSSWNHHAAATDETLPTFMMIAYQFLVSCDLGKLSYVRATKRLMFFLQHWNPRWSGCYSPQKNSEDAETFRSSLMVAAVSYGAEQDLREKFRALGFPINDPIFRELLAEVNLGKADSKSP